MAAMVASPPIQGCSPFLRWAGSKRRLLPILQRFWTPRHKRYVEPFAGSACLFFALQPPKAILGDLNPELIATYIEVKYRIKNVLSELKAIPPANKGAYRRLRDVDPLTLSAPARAARFIYLNRFCFNGIYRTNLRGKFNVPYSGIGCGRMPNDSVFQQCSRRLKCARFVHGDFEGVLAQAQKGDLVYMDPPFTVRARRVFREYGPTTFNHEDVSRLRAWMERLEHQGINFVVSYAESNEAEILRKGFSCTTVPVRRHIAGFASHRGLSNEVLISNV